MARPSKRRFELDTRQINFIKKKLNITKIEDVDTATMKLLKEKFKKLSDSRIKKKTKFKIWDILICSVLAVLFGADSWEDIHDFTEENYDFIRKFLLMTGGIPCAKTIERVLAIINHKELESIFNDFLICFSINNDCDCDIINIDGRVSRGSARNKTVYSKKQRPLNVLNAYSNNFGICLASEQIDTKTNEIPAVDDILNNFNVKGNIITWDALNTQKKNIEKVIELKGDYVVPIKGNQGTFHKDLINYFDDKILECIKAGNNNSAYLTYKEKRGCNIIIYEYYQTEDIKWFEDKDKWKKLKTIGVVKKSIYDGVHKRPKIEMRYYISSLGVNIDLFSKAIRNHWSVENKLHWHLDFTFRQDKNTTSNKNALFSLKLINKFCLGILKKIKPFFNNISLIRIRKKLSGNFEKYIVNVMCYLALC